MANNSSNLKEMTYGYPWFVGGHLAAASQGQQVAESYRLGVRLRERLYGRHAVLKSISAEEFGRVATPPIEQVCTPTEEVCTPTEVGQNEPQEELQSEPQVVAQSEPAEADSTLALIDDFISSGDHRKIVIGEQTTEESMATFGGDEGDDEEFVSEELAEIYAKQGLFDQAIAIYRKLSLQDSQKSIYFAELIGQLSEKCAQREGK